MSHEALPTLRRSTYIFALLVAHLLELQVSVDYVQNIHELSFVLVESFRHYFVDSVVWNFKTITVLFDPFLQSQFVTSSHFDPLLLELLIIRQVCQIGE